MSSPIDWTRLPLPGDPRRADPAWWAELWTRLADGQEPEPLSETTWETDTINLRGRSEAQRDEQDLCYRWLAELSTGPEGPACTPQNFVRGILVLGSQRPVQSHAVIQWLSWHGPGQRVGWQTGHVQRPVNESADERLAASQTWSRLEPTAQRQLVEGILRKMGRWSSLNQQWARPLLATLPASALGLTPAAWDALGERMASASTDFAALCDGIPTPGWTKIDLREQEIPEPLVRWMCQDPSGNIGDLAHPHGVTQMQEGLTSRVDWPQSALERYGRLEGDGEQLAQRLLRLGPQQEAPAAVFPDWAAVAELAPDTQLRLVTAAMQLCEQPGPVAAEDARLHETLTEPLRAMLRIGFAAESQLMEHTAVVRSSGGVWGVPQDVGLWRRRLRQLLEKAAVAPHLDQGLHRRGLMHADGDIRRLMAARIASQQVLGSSPPPNESVTPAALTPASPMARGLR